MSRRIDAWVCDVCKVWYTTEAAAEKCCEVPEARGGVSWRGMRYDVEQSVLAFAASSIDLDQLEARIGRLVLEKMYGTGFYTWAEKVDE